MIIIFFSLPAVNAFQFNHSGGGSGASPDKHFLRHRSKKGLLGKIVPIVQRFPVQALQER